MNLPHDIPRAGLNGAYGRRISGPRGFPSLHAGAHFGGRVIRNVSPQAFAHIRRHGGLGAADLTVNPTASPPPWLKSVTDLLQTGATIYQSERIAKENLKRAREGLPPLNAAQVKSLGAQANVNIELPPELKYGLLAGGAALLMILARNRGRR